MSPGACEGLLRFPSLLGLQLGHRSLDAFEDYWLLLMCFCWFLPWFLNIYLLLYNPFTSFVNKNNKASGNRWCYLGRACEPVHVLQSFCTSFVPFSRHSFWLVTLKGSFLVVHFSHLVLHSQFGELSAMCLGLLNGL